MAPHFKKLTDCPENLREAIDWLIQVRHGNGMNGIGELAKALKKLIDEAIDKAYTTNVGALLKLLNSAKSYTCCKDKVAEIGKLKDSKKIEDEGLTKLLQRVEAHKTSCYNHLDSSQQTAYDEIVSKLEQLKRLSESLNGFTNVDSCKQLLTKLCTGLETFLGFDSASKGYDGSGIVYSDLDRLCDAVMAFLHGVLESVKDDDAVKTYDGYIKRDIDRLDKLLEKVKFSIGKGSADFGKRVTEVSEWLGRYRVELNGKIGSITGPLYGLKTHLEKELKVFKIEDPKDPKGVRGEERYRNIFIAENVERKIHECLLKASNCIKEIFDIEKSGPQALDPVLKGKIHEPLKKIKKAFARFQGFSAKDRMRYEMITKTIEKQLKELNDKVDEDVRSRVEKLQQELSQKFTDTIKTPIEKVNKALQNVLQDLMAWINRAQQIAQNGIAQAQKILDEVKEQGNKKPANWQKVITQATALKGTAQKLYEAAAEVKKQIPTLVRTAKEAIDPFEEVYHNELKRINKAVNEAVTHIKGTGLKQLDDKVKAGLKGLKAKFAGPIEQYFKKVESALKTNNESSSHFMQGLWTHLEGKNGEAPILSSWALSARNVKDALGGLEMEGKYQHLKPFLAKFLEMQSEEKTFFGAIGAEVIQKVEGEVDTYAKDKAENQHFKSIMGDFITYKIENIENRVDTIKSEVERNFKKHNSMEVDNEAIDPKDSGQSTKERLEGTIEAFNNEVVKNHLKNVGDDSIEQEKKIDSATFGTMLSKVERNLNEVMNAIKTLVDDENKGMMEPNKGVKNYFEELQKMLNENGPNEGEEKGKSLDGIKDRINKILSGTPDGNLATIMKDATAFLENIENQSKLTITQIQATVQEQVTHKMKNITDQAEKQYVESRIHELSIFNTVVQRQYDVIIDILYQDKITGTKGSLGKLYKKIIANVESIKDMKATSTTLLLQSTTVVTAYSQSQNSSPLSKAAGILRKSFEQFLDDVSQFPGASAVDTTFNEVSNTLQGLLLQIESSRHFDYLSSSNRKALEDRIYEFKTATFRDNVKDVLAPLKTGLLNFTEQLGHAYVNRYSGMKFGGQLLVQKTVTDADNKASGSTKTVTDLTPEGRNCAKVCLTIVEILGHDLGELRKRCQKGDTYKYNKVCLRADKLENPLGAFLTECGYRVPSGDGSMQDGELRWKEEWTGGEIYTKLLTKEHAQNPQPFRLVSDYDEKHDEESAQKHSVLKNLVDYLNMYYNVCHYATSSAKRQPSSVHEMLVWLAGLPHNPVHRELTFTYFSELFDKPKQVPINISGDIISIEDTDDVPLSAYPEDVTPGKLTGALTGVCAHAHSTLTAILGHGHKDGIYAVDFNTNEYKLSYPSNTAACFDMLTDIVCRLYQQLIFIYYQCCDTTEVGGWRNCWYGNSIGGSSWKCNDIQCADQKCNQNAYQIANQIHDQNGDQHPQCGLKSPLQSFLEDGLPGFLPHSFTKPGCKLECTVSKHRGIPCITPMGFADLSDMASHRQSGKHLCAILADFCGSKNSCLTRICGYLICLLGKAPQTLDEMFSFYYNLLFEWNTKRIAREESTKHKRNAFEDAVKKAYFGVPYTEVNVDSIFLTREHTNGSLLCLVGCKDHSLMTCGRFLRPIGFNTWDVFSAKNAGRYLSWVVYITESFYDLLQKLYDDCCTMCDKQGTRCHDKSCADTCSVKSYYESKDSNRRFTDQKHSDKCHSIAKCRNMRPMLYKSGIMLARPYDLTGANEQLGKIRTCKDFCAALEKVLNKEEQLQRVLPKLVYVTIPEFLWKIRAKFFWTTLTLWLLSLLYLLHIMVIRLDLLHIKSHLHSPSSHRIAAQSLLAAARVGKLAKLTYLQP